MKLNLVRPLAFIDLETTGIDKIKDRIVQIAILTVFPNGEENMYSRKINPTIPIPIEISKIHGIYDKDVKEEATFADIAHELLNHLQDCDLAGYNSNHFDIPLLMIEFSRVGIDFLLEGRNIIDVQTIFFKMEPRNLKAAYKFYCGEDLVGAHDAANDIRATYEVLKSQLKHYENTPHEDKEGNLSYPIKNDVETLANFTPLNLLDPTNKIIRDEQGREVFNFGKYKGRTVVEVFNEDLGYYEWMMSKNFSVFTRKVITRIWESLQTQKT
jgi:DNA polymerase III subunit epsilon